MNARQRLLLSTYPLTKEILCRIEDKMGSAQTRALCLGELKKNSLSQIVTALRRLGHQDLELIVVISDHNYQPWLHILLTLASFISARCYLVSDFMGNYYRVTRTRIWLSAPWKLLYGTLRGIYSLLRASIDIRLLLSQPRIRDKHPGDVPDVLYLKTNLWMGVQAGGSIGHVAGIVNGFFRLKSAVVVYSAESLPLLDDGVSVAHIPIGACGGVPLEFNGYGFQHAYDRELKKITVDIQRQAIVYQRNCLVNYSGVLLSRRLNIPLIIEYNGSEVWISKNWGTPLRFFNTARKIEEVNLRHAHLIVVVSKVLRDELIERGIEPGRILFYPNCIDPDIFDPACYPHEQKLALRSQWNIPVDAVLCTFVGTFGPWHGVDVLARAVCFLAANKADWLRVKKLHFLFVGDGQLMQRVRALLADMPEEFYSFTGLVPQADAAGFLAASDILLSPHVPNPDGSRFFGSPTKLFEYMAMGKPIIASELEQIGEVLAGSWHIGRNGIPQSENNLHNSVAILATPGSSDELALALEYLTENPKVCVNLGTAARALVLEQYTWEKQVRQIINQLEHIAS